MLTEIRVSDLGVIEHLALPFAPGMTALTGETGAGKTLVVEALELLVGGRADTQLVRAGAVTAVVEGRFVLDGAPDSKRSAESDELVVAREVPSDGRSRAYVDGRMATAQSLAEVAGALVDLHGQHAHQSLLHTGAQRLALDHFAAVDTAEVERLEGETRDLGRRIAELGGDELTLRREVDLLRFQLGELEGAALGDPGEEEELATEAELLTAVVELRQAAEEARSLLTGSDRLEGASALAAGAASALKRHAVLEHLGVRLDTAATELEDVARELRTRAEGFEEDPERLAAVEARRRLFADLRRKYGESLGEVIEFREQVRQRLGDLEAGEARRSELEAALAEVEARLEAAEAGLAGERAAAAPRLAAQIEGNLRDLALPRARFEVEVAGSRGEQVTFLLAANPGEPALPLAKVASGGELARTMLATRLVLTEAPPTLVFDEVDAGVGGEAALAVGRALSQIARDHQVLVVTHLAQVAAFADAHVVVRKQVRDGRTVASAELVTGEERLRELSRMLSGQPDSAAARLHAEELVEMARQMREAVSPRSG